MLMNRWTQLLCDFAGRGFGSQPVLRIFRTAFFTRKKNACSMNDGNLLPLIRLPITLLESYNTEKVNFYSPRRVNNKVEIILSKRKSRIYA